MSSPLHALFPATFSNHSQAATGHCPLLHLGVIRAAGADAVAFLQGQLTQDVSLLPVQGARLAAFCNAKGRMQASLIVIKPSDQELLLVCLRDVLPALLKRLSMFVLRAKVKLSDASGDFTLLGLAGGESTAAPWSCREVDGAHVVTLYPGAGVPLALWLAPVSTPSPASIASSAELTAQQWQWLTVRSGIALVGQATFEAYVPQMLNYESVGGVSFKKGCYPGQEVVARSQFRGTLKRRAFVVHADGPLAAGQEVFLASDAEQACGTVAAAAPCPDAQGWDAIVSMQISAAQSDAGPLRAAGMADSAGPALTLLALPYPLLEDL
jgi:tRNA-modifying protein YgfZ